MKAQAKSAQIAFSPAILFIAPLLIGVVSDVFWTPGWPLGLPKLWQFFGLLLVLSGFLTVREAARALIEASKSLPRSRGDTAIVLKGIYRYSRNPMYFGMAMIQLGLTFMFLSPAALMLFPLTPILVQLIVISREERYLRAEFGDLYESYCQKVPRWI